MQTKNVLGLFCALALAMASSVVADVKITRLANEGVVIEDNVTRIMIDGLVVEPYALYGGLPPELAEQYGRAEGPFADIDLALASHQHHDHNQPEFACNFLNASTSTEMATSLQVLALMRERCRDLVTTSSRIREIDPQYNAPVVIHEETAVITVFLLTHGVGKYARLQNFGHLVDIGGMRILHIGDAAMTPEDFEVAGLEPLEIDVALIPFWFFQPGPGMAVVDRFMNANAKIAVHIPPAEMEEVQLYLTENYPEVQVLVEPGDSVTVTSLISDAVAPPPP